MGDMMIKQLDITDQAIAKQVLEVQLPAYQVEAELIGFTEIPPLKDTVATLQACEEQFYGFYIGDELAGVISFQWVEDVLDIHRLVVHPAFFRQGIGRKLLQYVMDKWDKARGFVVKTACGNTPALNLYTSMGFQAVEQVQISSHLTLCILERKVS